MQIDILYCTLTGVSVVDGRRSSLPSSESFENGTTCRQTARRPAARRNTVTVCVCVCVNESLLVELPSNVSFIGNLPAMGRGESS